MISEFIYDISIEINKDSSSMNLDELIHNIELLDCSQALTAIFCELGEVNQEGNIIFDLEEKIDSDEDFSDDAEILLNYLAEVFPGLIEEGSKFQYINRSAILSVSWIMEDSEWKSYQDMNRDYGIGEFDDESEEW